MRISSLEKSSSALPAFRPGPSAMFATPIECREPVAASRTAAITSAPGPFRVQPALSPKVIGFGFENALMRCPPSAGAPPDPVFSDILQTKSINAPGPTDRTLRAARSSGYGAQCGRFAGDGAAKPLIKRRPSQRG